MKIPVLLIFACSYAVTTTAQSNLAKNGTTRQSTTFSQNGYNFGSSLAVTDGPTNDYDTFSCATTNKNQYSAWWMLTFMRYTVYIENVKIYYRDSTVKRFSYYSVYVSNSTVTTGGKPTGHLCYQHDGTTSPSLTERVNCFAMGRNVIIYNHRNSTQTYPSDIDSYAWLELCDVQVYGCFKGWHGTNCSLPCPSNCVSGHCYPRNGFCIWGCREGYSGEKCDEGLNIGAIVGGIIGGIIGVVLVAFGGVWLYEVLCKRQEESQMSDTNSKKYELNKPTADIESHNGVKNKKAVDRRTERNITETGYLRAANESSEDKRVKKPPKTEKNTTASGYKRVANESSEDGKIKKPDQTAKNTTGPDNKRVANQNSGDGRIKKSDKTEKSTAGPGKKRGANKSSEDGRIKKPDKAENNTTGSGMLSAPSPKGESIITETKDTTEGMPPAPSPKGELIITETKDTTKGISSPTPKGESITTEAKDITEENSDDGKIKPCTRIEVSRFQEMVNEKKRSNTFQSEFMKYEAGLLQDHVIGTNNTDKNRYEHIIPYDHSRVVLQTNMDSDYINASYIKNCNDEKTYIAAQGPMQNTTRDFWQMILQENVEIIVLLLKSKDEENFCEYWPKMLKSKDYEGFSIRIISRDPQPAYIYREMRIYSQNAQKTVHQIQFNDWKEDSSVEIQNLINFYRQFKDIQRKCDHRYPVVVHCNDGCWRTGCFIALDALYEYAQETGFVDVPAYIHQMRKDRLNMIESMEQYQNLYEALAEVFTNPIAALDGEKNNASIDMPFQFMDETIQDTKV